MALSINQLRLRLGADEPDYPALARLGPAIVPKLVQLVTDRFEYVAANAASLAGLIGGEQAVTVLARAAQNPSPLVRTAAAAALARAKGPQVAGLVAKLLSDRDHGVRKFAILSAAARPNAAFAAKIADMSKRDPQAHLRALAAQALNRTRLA